jgi:hypothetical protein
MTDECISLLRQRMIEDMSLRNFGEKTQKDYIRAVKKRGEAQSRNDQQPHAQGSRRSKVPRKIEANGKALSCACRQRLEGVPNARRSRRRSRGGEEWELPARR